MGRSKRKRGPGYKVYYEKETADDIGIPSSTIHSRKNRKIDENTSHSLSTENAVNDFPGENSLMNNHVFPGNYAKTYVDEMGSEEDHTSADSARADDNDACDGSDDADIDSSDDSHGDEDGSGHEDDDGSEANDRSDDDGSSHEDDDGSEDNDRSDDDGSGHEDDDGSEDNDRSDDDGSGHEDGHGNDDNNHGEEDGSRGGVGNVNSNDRSCFRATRRKPPAASERTNSRHSHSRHRSDIDLSERNFVNYHRFGGRNNSESDTEENESEEASFRHGDLIDRPSDTVTERNPVNHYAFQGTSCTNSDKEDNDREEGHSSVYNSNRPEEYNEHEHNYYENYDDFATDDNEGYDDADREENYVDGHEEENYEDANDDGTEDRDDHGDDHGDGHGGGGDDGGGGGGGGGGGEERQENSEEEEDDDGREPFRALKSKLQEEFKNPLNLNVQISVGEVLTNALNLVKKHNMNHTAKTDIMRFASSILQVGDLLPKTRYLLDKYLYSKVGMTYYFFCFKCTQQLGSVSSTSTRAHQIICPNKNCGEINKLNDLSKASYFVVFDLRSQLALLFEDQQIRSNLLNPTDFVNGPPDNILNDLHHGSSYRNFASYVQRNIANVHNKVISFALSVDSASICSFSGQKICPCFVTVNELPPVLRMENLLLAGIWFGTKKEVLSLFLPPIVDHITKLSSGFDITVDETLWHMKAFLIACVADSVARCDIQGLHSHRGDFPCNWCLIEGEEYGAARIFPYMLPPSPPRTIEELLADSREALRSGTFVNGVKYLSLLAPAPLFHPVEGFIVDHMHAKDEGSTKSFLKAWLEDGPLTSYYIGAPANLKKINDMFKLISAPRELRRGLRNLKDLAFWTARELENFEFFISIPLLVNILPRKYLKHWALYVQGTYILMSRQISSQAIDIAEILLVKFCEEVESLYNRSMMRFNLHILLHFAENTRRWGPMFALSAYAFEAGNHMLKKDIHAANYIPSQIARSMSENRALAILKRECSTPLTRTFEESINRKTSDVKILSVGKIKLIGVSKNYESTAEEMFILQQRLLPLVGWLSFKLLRKDGTHYGPKTANPLLKTDNSYARLNNNRFIQIHNVLYHEISNDIVLFASRIRCRLSPYCPEIVQNFPDLCFQFIVNSIDEDVNLYTVDQLESVCVSLSFNHGHFLCPMPNVFNMF